MTEIEENEEIVEIINAIKLRRKIINEYSKKVKQVDNDVKPNDLKLGEYIITNKEKIPFIWNGIEINDLLINKHYMFKYNYIIHDLNLKKPIKKVLIVEFEDLEELNKKIASVELENLGF